ncbi:MAG: hypothetical protein ACREPQ_18180 [Rhodanobacter sp.]
MGIESATLLVGFNVLINDKWVLPTADTTRLLMVWVTREASVVLRPANADEAWAKAVAGSVASAAAMDTPNITCSVFTSFLRKVK